MDTIATDEVLTPMATDPADQEQELVLIDQFVAVDNRVQDLLDNYLTARYRYQNQKLTKQITLVCATILTGLSIAFFFTTLVALAPYVAGLALFCLWLLFINSRKSKELEQAANQSLECMKEQDALAQEAYKILQNFQTAIQQRK